MMTQNNILDWSQLSMKQRAAFIRNAVARGISNIDDIRQDYNIFKDGGDTKKQVFLNSLEKALSKNKRYNTPEWRKYLTELALRESSFRPDVTNKIGAKGYFQLMPENRTSTWTDPTQQFEQMFALTDSNLDYFKRNMTKADLIKAQQQGVTIYDLARAAHLGGAHNALKALRGQGNAKDINGTSVLNYMKGSGKGRSDLERQGFVSIYDNTGTDIDLQQQPIVTADEIIQNAAASKPATQKEDIQATVEVPEVTVIGHRPQINPFNILPQIQESAPTPLVLEPYQIPNVQNTVNNIATQRNTFLQQGLEDRILAEERRRKLGYSYRDSSIEDNIRQLQFLRNMSANGGKLFEIGGDTQTTSEGSFADPTWHENWLNNRQEQFNENVSPKPRKFKKLGVDTVEGQINNLRNTEETYNTSEFRNKTGNSAPFMYKQYGIGAMTFPKADGSGNIIWYSPIYSGKPYEPLTLEKSYNKDMTQEDIDRWNRKQGYELAPEQEVMATRVHEWTHGLSPLDPNNPTNTGLLPQHEKIRRINKEMGIMSTKTDGHTSLYDNDAYRNDVEETYAGVMQQRYELGLDPKHHVEMEEIQEWRDRELLNEYLVGKPNEVLYRYFNEVADNSLPIINDYGIPNQNIRPNIAALGGPLLNSEYKHGGNTVGEFVDAIYENNPREEYLGEPSHHYDFTQSEEWANAHGYYPNARGHRDDRVKKPAHPSHPSRGIWDKDKFILTDVGMQNPNYILFGLNDGGQDPQATLIYDNGVVLPEFIVTPKGNYIENPYDNIRIHYKALGGPKNEDYPEGYWENKREHAPIKPRYKRTKKDDEYWKKKNKQRAEDAERFNKSAGLVIDTLQQQADAVPFTAGQYNEAAENQRQESLDKWDDYKTGIRAAVTAAELGLSGGSLLGAYANWKNWANANNLTKQTIANILQKAQLPMQVGGTLIDAYQTYDAMQNEQNFDKYYNAGSAGLGVAGSMGAADLFRNTRLNYPYIDRILDAAGVIQNAGDFIKFGYDTFFRNPDNKKAIRGSLNTYLDTNSYEGGGDLLGGVKKGSTVDVDQCAQWSNSLLRNNGYLINGNAWNLGNVDTLFNGFEELEKPKAYDRRIVEDYNHAAANNVYRNFDSKTLDTSRPYAVNMYYNDSPAQEEAFNNGKGVTGTHTGILTYDEPSKQWLVTHNIHGRIYQEPFISLQSGKGKYGVTAIYEPRRATLWNRAKGFFGFNNGGYLSL